MKILLINSNPVISRLFALCLRNTDIELDELKSSDAVEQGEEYDLFFIDDASCGSDMQSFIKTHSLNYSVYLSYGTRKVAGFDKTVKKPFLPSQISDIIKDLPVKEAVEEVPILFEPSPRYSVKRENEEMERENGVVTPPHVLDSEEIEKIKNLLDIDTAEQGEKSGMVQKPKKQKKRKRTFTQDEFLTIEKAFGEALFSLEPKKIKKLLRGKEITIKVKIKDRF